jgi:hypothetical protein
VAHGNGKPGRDGGTEIGLFNELEKCLDPLYTSSVPPSISALQLDHYKAIGSISILTLTKNEDFGFIYISP